MSWPARYVDARIVDSADVDLRLERSRAAEGLARPVDVQYGTLDTGPRADTCEREVTE